MEPVTTIDSSVPVVGIPVQAGKSHHAGEILRCPTEKKLYTLSSSGSQTISYDPSLKRCQNFKRPSKRSIFLKECHNRSDTKITHPNATFNVCDLCFCSNKWILLLLLFSMLPTASAADISVSFGSIDLGCLMIFILLFSFLCLHYLSTMYAKTIATVEKFMEENTRRHFWRLGTDIFMSFLRPTQPSFQLQGYATDFMQVFTKFLKVFVGAAAVFCLCAGHEYDWYKRLVSFTKNSSAVIYATKSLEKFFSGDFSFPLSKNEKSEELTEAMEMSWMAGARFAPMVALLKQGGRFDEKLMDDFFLRLKPKEIQIEIANMLTSDSAKSYLAGMKERKESCEALLIVLADHYALKPQEIQLPQGNEEKLGLGLAPPADDLPWLCSSYLMKAAIRADFLAKIAPMKDKAAQARLEAIADAKCEAKWLECLEKWKTHSLLCEEKIHNECNLNLGSLLALEVQRVFGSAAWPVDYKDQVEQLRASILVPTATTVERTREPVQVYDAVPLLADLDPLFLPVQIPEARTGDAVLFVIPESAPQVKVPGFNFDLVTQAKSLFSREEGKEREEELDLSAVPAATDINPQSPLVTTLLTNMGRAAQVPAAADLSNDRFLPKSLPDMVVVMSDKALNPPPPQPKVAFVKATIQSVFSTAYSSVKHFFCLNFLKAKHRVRRTYFSAAESCQYFIAVACIKLGYLSSTTKIDKVNMMVDVAKLSSGVQDALKDEEIDSSSIVAHNNFAGKVLLESPQKILNGVLTISSIFLVLALGCAASYTRQRSKEFKYSYAPRVSREGYVGASGAKDIDKEVNEWEDSIVRGEKVKGRLSRFEEIAAGYHDKRNQGFVNGVQLGQLLVNAVLEKYVHKKVTAPVSCDPSAKQAILAAQEVHKCPQGRLLPDNVGVAMSRTFGTFSDPSCLPESYLLNSFLVGRYLFSEQHNLPDQFWIRSLAGQVYEMHLKNFKLAPGHKDLVYTLWSSPVSCKKISLALPEVMQPVVLVSSRGTDYTIKDGIVIGVGEAHGWATYNSIAGDCAGPVVNAQGLVVGFHQLGTDVFANGFLKVDQALIDLVKQNGEPPLVSACLQANSLDFNYQRNDALPAGCCVRNKFFSGHFLAYAKSVGAITGLQDYNLPSFRLGQLEEGLKKFDHSEPNPDYFTLKASFSDLLVELSQHVGVSKRSTIEDIHAAADQTSGPGYPYCRTYQTKAALFAAKPDLWRTFTEQPEDVVWYAKLKCEVREIGKMARTYLACPVSFAYYANQFFLDFNNRFYTAGAKMNGFFSSVAMVPQYGGWQRLKDSLFARGFSFDGKKFDTRVHSTLLWYCCYARIQKFESAEIPSFIWCYSQFINSKIFTPEGFSCVKSKGMPSGGVNTIVDNTMVLYMMINYAFRRVSSLSFSEHVKLALNGDDSLITISEEALKTFDAKAFVDVLQEDFGMTFTTENWAPLPVEQLDYLSRYFHTKIDGVIVPWFPFTKIRASLSFSSHPNSLGYSLCRAYGILAEMWPNRDARWTLMGYIAWLKTMVDENDPWTKLANKMELPEWQLAFMATGIPPLMSVDTSAVAEALPYYLPGELQSATPGKGKFIIPLHPEMDAINKNKIANMGGNKKVPHQQKKQKKKQPVPRAVVKVVRNDNSKILKSRFRAPASAFRTTMDSGLAPALERLRLSPAETRNVVDVFNSVCMPGVGKNIRIGEEFGARPSGVASLFNREDTSFATLPGFAAQTFVFKSALRYQLSSIAPLEYRAASARSYVGQAEVKIAAVFSSFTCLSAPLLSTNGDGWHGSTVYPGRLGPSDPYYGYIGNASDRFSIDIPLAPGGYAFNCTMYKFAAKEWQPEESKAIISSTVTTFDITSFGYYAFGLTSPGSVVGVSFNPVVRLALDLGVGVSTIDPCWAQLSLPGLRENIDTVQNVKFHGLSLMWTNTSNMLSKQGQIAMMQVPADSWFGNYVGYANVSSKNVKVEANLDATQGGYLFQKPSTIKDFEFTNEIVSGNQGSSYAELPGSGSLGIANTWFYIIPQLDFITMALDIPPVAGIADARTGYWTVRADIEYSSTDQWRSLQLPTVRKDDLEKALSLIAAAPQFHTNEFHISDLWTWIKNAAKSVGSAIVEYGPTVLKIATAVAPLLL